MLILFASFAVLLILGVPIAYALGVGSLCYVALASDMSPLVVVQKISAGADSLILLALPLFLLTGEVMNAAGITRKLTNMAMSIVGPTPGGLSLVVILANILIAMVSGAAVASAAAVGSTTFPIMLKHGYPRGYAAAVNAASATVGPVIPPSVGFIIYASVSGASIGKLFLAGVLPGFLMSIGLALVCICVAVTKDYPRGEWQGFRWFRRHFVSALPGLLMPVIILGGILGGFVTPTEAGAIAAGYGLFVGFFVYRTLKLTDLPSIFLRTATRSATILFVIASAACFGFLIARELEPTFFVQAFQSLTDQSWVVMLLAIGLFLSLGTVMEGGSMMIIFTPLLLPVLKSYEIDVLHFGVVFQLVIMIGLLSPPIGMLLFVISGVSKVSVHEVVEGLWPFYTVLFLVVLVVAFFPQLSLVLVEKYGGHIK